VTRSKKYLFGSVGILLVTFTALQTYFENGISRVSPHEPWPVSEKARQLHKQLIIGDWHMDTLVSRSDILTRSTAGHADIPRLREGNVALQMFTTASKVPMFRDHVSNSAHSPDAISALAAFQGWPFATWNDLTERTLLQGSRLQEAAKQAPNEVVVIRTTDDLNNVLARREKGEPVIGGLLGIEGAHALEGKLESVDRVYNHGFRMIGLQHFFDNDLGGSLHGEVQGGLTPFGKQVVERMDELGMIIDLAHSSETVVSNVLELTKRPVVVSHTGFKGNCDLPRNIPDELMKRIADSGGLIAVGYWDKAICDATPEGIVSSIRYGIDRFGVDHIALGSDFDGGTTTYLDVSELAILTEIMLQKGFSEMEIRKVMGGNMVRFLQDNLPSSQPGLLASHGAVEPENPAP
jgi:membrane dipeptidase